MCASLLSLGPSCLLFLLYGLSVWLGRLLYLLVARVLYRCWCVFSYFIGQQGNNCLYSWMWCPSLNPSVKLHALHGSVVPAGVIVMLGLCNPSHWGHGEPVKPRLLYPLVRIPCCDTVSEKLGLWSRVGSIASDLESFVTCCDRQDYNRSLGVDQVLVSRPSHVAGGPPSPGSTNLQLRIPCYCHLESVPVKPTRKRLQSGVGRPGSLAGSQPLGPLVSGICTLPPHVRCIPGVTLTLVEFQFSL
jgi:hypothetical protein